MWPEGLEESPVVDQELLHQVGGGLVGDADVPEITVISNAYTKGGSA